MIEIYGKLEKQKSFGQEKNGVEMTEQASVSMNQRRAREA